MSILGDADCNDVIAEYHIDQVNQCFNMHFGNQVLLYNNYFIVYTCKTSSGAVTLIGMHIMFVPKVELTHNKYLPNFCAYKDIFIVSSSVLIL